MSYLKELSSISSLGFHQLWVKIQHRKLGSIIVCVAYRPPNCPVTCFMDDLFPNYLQALTYGKDIFLRGDLNCNMLKDIPESRALRELSTCLNLSQLITSPTRVTERSSSLIDVIMTSNSSSIMENGTLDVHLSDHYLVFSVLSLKIPEPAPVYITARNYKNYDSSSSSHTN